MNSQLMRLYWNVFMPFVQIFAKMLNLMCSFFLKEFKSFLIITNALRLQHKLSSFLKLGYFTMRSIYFLLFLRSEYSKQDLNKNLLQSLSVRVSMMFTKMYICFDIILTFK